jgi:hypothetical protein
MIALVFFLGFLLFFLRRSDGQTFRRSSSLQPARIVVFHFLEMHLD